jgi:hypothetical protein
VTADLARRLEPLFAAARRLAAPDDVAAEAARTRIAASSGLSQAGVELALALSLEKAPSDAELHALAKSVPQGAANAHVLLSANVFVATHRAIALALAAAPRVFVRASRREPEMARWYADAAPGLFELVSTLEPEAGDVVFAYGGAPALARVIPAFPQSTLKAYGPGFGLVACEGAELRDEQRRSELGRHIALDAVLFDQRGCLSPRLVLVEGDMALALKLAEAIAAALEHFATEVPLGRVTAEERAEIRRYGETMTYAGELCVTAAGAVGVAALDAPPLLSPVARTLHIAPVTNAIERARALAADVTSVAVAGATNFRAALTKALPEARLTEPGMLQRPAFDGPVDRRQRPLSAWTPPALRV